MQAQANSEPITAVLHAESDFAVGRCGPVFIVVWKVDTTPVGMSRVAALFRSADLPERVGMLTIIDEDATMPSSEARDIGAAFLAKNRGRIVASAVAHEGSGFKAATVRAIVTGLSLLARQPFPHKVFPDAQQAASWLCEVKESGFRLSTIALVRQCAAIRSA
jgi:hypothetical protein